MKPKYGFESQGEFAKRVGCSYPTVINWVLLGKLPFKVDEETQQKLIPIEEALAAPCVKKYEKRIVAQAEAPPEVPIVSPASGYKLLTPDRIPQDEKLFLVARDNAKQFVTRARFCRMDHRHEAEAELLWMALENFGFTKEMPIPHQKSY